MCIRKLLNPKIVSNKKEYMRINYNVETHLPNKCIDAQQNWISQEVMILFS